MAERNGTKTLFDKIKPLIDSEIEKRTRSCCRTKSMVVTTAYNADTQTVGVSEAAGNEINIPVCGNVDVTKLTIGTPVWVFSPYSSMSNAIVFMLGDGETGYAAFAGNANELGGNPPSFYIPPIGIVLPFWNDTEPASIWGGVWELLAEGLTLIQSGTNYPLGSTGGEAEHTLTESEIPSHRHIGRIGYQKNGFGYNTLTMETYLKSLTTPVENTRDTPLNDIHVTNIAPTTDTGGSQSHNNMPPYLAVNLWKRTA